MKKRVVKSNTNLNIAFDDLFNEYIPTEDKFCVYSKNMRKKFRIGRFVTDVSVNNYCLISIEDLPDIYSARLNISLKDYIEYLLNSNECEIYFEDNKYHGTQK